VAGKPKGGLGGGCGSQRSLKVGGFKSKANAISQRAIQAAHWENSVLLAAFDGVPEFIDLIRQGKVVASGMQQPYLMGARSAQAMFDHLKGKTPPKEILVPIIVVSQRNLDEVLSTVAQTVFANELKK
jgi:ribose transport system substrate-binding protein